MMGQVIFLIMLEVSSDHGLSQLYRRHPLSSFQSQFKKCGSGLAQLLEAWQHLKLQATILVVRPTIYGGEEEEVINSVNECQERRKGKSEDIHPTF